MQKPSQKHRLLIADEAAKIISEESCADFHTAKQKAASRLGFSTQRNLPTNSEIEQALLERLRLFGGENRILSVQKLRETALEAMEFLEEFHPHLVGSVLSGTGNEFSDIQLHLFSDDLESIAIHLINNGIHYRSIEYQPSRESEKILPGFEWAWKNASIVALVFDNGLRIAPPDPIHGKPMQRASIEEVVKLLSD